MTQTDLKPGFTLAFVQDLVANAVKLYGEDNLKFREAFSNALSFAQSLLVPPVVTRIVSTVHDPIKREYPVTFQTEGGEAHIAVGVILKDLQAAKVVPSGAGDPKIKKNTTAVFSADYNYIIKNTKELFSLT